MITKLMTLRTTVMFVLVTLCLSVSTHAQDACGCDQTALGAINNALFDTSECVVECQGFGSAVSYCEEACWSWFQSQLGNIADDYDTCACA